MLIVKSELCQKTVFLATTNSVATKNGLVMGAGSALELKKWVPEAPRIIARALYARDYALDGTERYGSMVFSYPTGFTAGWGIFQTKTHWKCKSDMETITNSVLSLLPIVRAYDKTYFRIPFPGIGYGKTGAGAYIDEKEILKLIEILPDNVLFFKR